MKKIGCKNPLILSVLLIAATTLPLPAQDGPESMFQELDKEVEGPATNQNQMDTGNAYKTQDGKKKTFQKNMEEQLERWNKLSAEMEAQWAEMVQRVNRQREELKARVEQQWKEFYYSTNKEWVDYSDDMGTRSRVDFENGVVEVETLVPVDEATEGTKEKANFSELNKDQKKKVKQLAEQKIEKKVKKILSKENDVQSEVLKDQIKDSEGNTVTEKNSDQYVKKHVVPEMQVEEEPVVAKDGKPRLKVKVKIKMVPEHLRIRAEKYKDQVNQYSEKYKLEPALIYAVIHTESFFNPLAKSWVPAYGLMQLVPRYGALEAYEYLYHEEKLLPYEYLYNPDNNIMLGATYLYILQSNYLGGIKNGSNRQILSVASYNWGPTRVIKKIVKKHNVDQLSEEETVRLINQVAPKETQDYVERIQKRMLIYRNM